MFAAILFQTCAAIIPLPKDSVAPCDGLLWSEDATRSAIRCRRVDLPRLTADLKLCTKTNAAKIKSLEIKLKAAEAFVEESPEPPAAWLLPTISAASFVVGGILASVILVNL